jgi:hypothetical protein
MRGFDSDARWRKDVTAGCTASFIAVKSCNFSAEHDSKFTKKAAYVNGAVDGSRINLGTTDHKISLARLRCVQRRRFAQGKRM